MYHMLHATDHKEAPDLMHRAYHQAVARREPPEQFIFEFGEWRDADGRIVVERWPHRIRASEL